MNQDASAGGASENFPTSIEEYNNTLCFEGNTLIARPEGMGEGRTEGAA